MKERWLPVVGWEGLYEVSDFGRVKSLYRKTKRGAGFFVRTERLMAGTISRLGYHIVMFSSLDGCQKNFLVHRLVANSFVENPNNNPQVNHMDGVKTNNFYKNLEWVTPKENMRHGFRTGLIPYAQPGRGDNSYASKLKEYQVVEIKKRIAMKESFVEIAKDYPITRSAISEIKAGRSWGHVNLPNESNWTEA